MTLSASDQARLVYGWGHRRQDLAAYGFTSGSRPTSSAKDFLSFYWMADRVRPSFNSAAAAALTSDKWVFYRMAAGFGIPIPNTLGLYDPVYGVTWDGQRRLQSAGHVVAEVRRHRPAGLVLKPVGGKQGRGLLILDEIDHSTGRVVTRTGVRSTLEEAVAGIAVAGLGDYPGYIVQEPVHAHPVFAELAPWTTNTVRIVTLIASDGEVHVLTAITLLGRRGNMANNWHSGGVNVAVDVETGVLGRGVLLEPQEWVTHHPDTGRELTGVQVPMWDETLQVCRRAARMLHGVRSIGWDVVLTPDGPVILEANAYWELRLNQIHSDGFLADPVIRARFVDAGAPMPAESVVKGFPRRAVKQVRGRLRSLIS